MLNFDYIFYREIRLPRIIMCGRTENMFPQIVIADSKRKERGERCKRLIGQLTESVTMRQKLVLEDVIQEVDKYVRFSYAIKF